MKSIQKVAVLGAGVMGQGIAAQLAGSGIPCYLLDIVPPQFTEQDQKIYSSQKDPLFRNKFAMAGIAAIEKSKPSLIYSRRNLKRITPGNFEDDWEKLKDCDWVIEVVIEKLEIKRSVFERIEKTVREGTWVSSNTSGIPLAQMSAGRNISFLKNFLITHFFNPVRYMKLVEIVASENTDPETLLGMASFLEDRLGKGVVYAKDRPNFIGNRIGLFYSMNIIHRAIVEKMSVEEVDKIFGNPMAKPKSAVFRTNDLVGTDIGIHVVQAFYDQCPQDESRETFKIPPLLEKMVSKGWLGDKVGQGFYKKVKKGDGSKEILALDLQTLEYRPQREVKFESLKAIKGIESAGERIKAFLSQNDRAAEFAWKSTRDTLIYSARRIPDIADDIVNIDNAMKWGFQWELGPFEIADALGVKNFVARLQNDGLEIPPLFQAVLEKGDGVFYKKKDGKRYYFDIKSFSYQPVAIHPRQLSLGSLREQNKIIKSNASASLIDLGEGVLCLEFHSKMNALDDEIESMAWEGVNLLQKDAVGMVIHNEATNFSVGANLMLLWLESQQKNWNKIETMIKRFQDLCMAFKYSPKPVVAAPFGLSLGGGCEVAMGADAIRAHTETYMGLVEVGVGLIPAGGGCKNLLLNWEGILRAKGSKIWGSPGDGGPFPKVQQTFEKIGFAKVSTSAEEAIELGYLKPTDKISLNRSHQLFDAKQDVLKLAKNYTQPSPREDILVPGIGGKMAIISALRGSLALKIISEHDALIAEKLGHVLCGGNIPTQRMVSENFILDLERETFLQLCGEEKSQARMQAMLMTGKPLRN